MSDIRLTIAEHESPADRFVRELKEFRERYEPADTAAAADFMWRLGKLNGAAICFGATHSGKRLEVTIEADGKKEAVA